MRWSGNNKLLSLDEYEKCLNYLNIDHVPQLLP
jgi:hypothetical protein